MKVGFNSPYITGNELSNVESVLACRQLAGDGYFTKRCHEWLEKYSGSYKALLTHSCTAALEMSALLADIQPGDEVIMPSYTFVSTANAFTMRGGIPVFVDIRTDNLNLDESLIEAAITERTKAIVTVHYAGVSCEMDSISSIAAKHELFVVEDAAQGVMSTYKGRALGSIGDFGCFSFHETKNATSGEGGALLVNDSRHAERAEIIREKGTNRNKFFRGQVDKYTWVDLGSSYLPSEITAAVLWAQLEQARPITEARLSLWNRYQRAFEALELEGFIRRPIISQFCSNNAHMYYLLMSHVDERTRFIEHMRRRGVQCTFHYVPLHSSPFGQRIGRQHGSLANTVDLAERLVRFPMWVGLAELQDYVIEATFEYFEHR
jgi:dTDP-4-amino-4,6-dideoxygalactose transaminase